MKAKKEKHYGVDVWVSPKIEKLRKTDCLCLNCGHMDGSSGFKCSTAEIFFEQCVKQNIALAVTRCQTWVQLNQ